MIPCYFQDNTVNDPGAPTIAPLSHRIKWSHVTKEKTSTILVASEGKVQVDIEYLDRVTMVNYPLVPTDATLEITELRSKDSGTYRCEVMHSIEDNYDSVEVQVQGMAQNQNADKFNFICTNTKPFTSPNIVQCFNYVLQENAICCLKKTIPVILPNSVELTCFLCTVLSITLHSSQGGKS